MLPIRATSPGATSEAMTKPILAGAKSHPSWRGELLGVADTSAAIQAMRDRLRPGDAVLVKASRVAAIEGIALALAGEKEPAR